MNGEAVEHSSERLHNPDTVMALDAMLEQLDPEVVLYDMPPALVGDDVLALALASMPSPLPADVNENPAKQVQLADNAKETQTVTSEAIKH